MAVYYDVAEQSDGPITVYGLVDPRDGTVRYIGSTKRHVCMRYEGHINRLANGKDTKKARWIKELADNGMRPHLVILERTSVDKRWATEWHWCKAIAIWQGAKPYNYGWIAQPEDSPHA